MARLRIIIRCAVAVLATVVLVLGIMKATDIGAFGQTVSAHGLLKPPAEAVACGCGFSQAPVEHWQPIVARNAAIAAACFATLPAFGRSRVEPDDEIAVNPATP